MAQRFVSADRDQEWLLPPSMRDWLPEGHLAWFVIELVDELDLCEFAAVYRQDGQGRPPFDPAVMVALLVHSYCVGVRSSRQIERRCMEDVASRVVAGGLQPDHVTIARFRSRHQDALAGLFSQVLGVCAKAGLVQAGTVAIDGTKVLANASLSRSMTVEGLRAEAERILGEAERVDAAEDAALGEHRGDELPDELANPRTRAGRIRKLLDEVEAEQQAVKDSRAERIARYDEAVARGRRPEGRVVSRNHDERELRVLRKKVNVTDPDSRIVRSPRGLIQGYNAQATVGEGQIVIAARIAPGAADQTQLGPMIQAAREELAAAGIQQTVQRVLADSGYWNTPQMTAAQQAGIETIVPPTSQRGEKPARKRKPPRGEHADRINGLLATPEGQRIYKARQYTVEPVFAYVKHLRRIDRFSRRGRAAVEAEWQLITATHNVLKLHRAATVAT
ncbi:transposase [Paraconexibacter antarcticus]|uniref:Transposase n=1 Tax=Paraconexibacter antarcticus TaxID=2949664 RepID=A0ABY5DX47_9ACTN|nr:transposase [Paraconexibacter antarcticus]UTI63275.1 transposase [Paraconexibacter antarcticus]UTI66251.1 transposase [Paraconexibacter antarcticus]